MGTLVDHAKDALRFARDLGKATGTDVYVDSISVSSSSVFALGRKGTEKRLLVVDPGSTVIEDFEGAEKEVSVSEITARMKICPLTHQNAVSVRRHLSFLRPTVLGLRKSVGLGDRLGLATPGHVLAVRKGKMHPIFCQQSIREMARTKRSPEEVMDDATWGVLQAGWREGYGADADHLKTKEDIDICLGAGFVFYTLDPGAYVDASAENAHGQELSLKYQKLPWDALQSNPQRCLDSYSQKIELQSPETSLAISLSGEEVQRAAVKYGKAMAHVCHLYKHLKSRFGGNPFEVEVSVDETDTPTTVGEHYYIASELKRLGVRWVSLAPRFIGRFEKGVDYIGNLDAFRADFKKHVAVAKALGPYKISLHSGSDKFSIYPIAAEQAGELIHLKTSGTSYLVALETIARVNPQLFREILIFAHERYPEDRASYHVSADVSQVANIRDISDRELPGLLNEFNTREVCHVTFGSVLNDTRFRERFFITLQENEEVYYQALEEHIGKHIRPFN